MLAHSFHRFYVVTKFILPSANDLRFLAINFDPSCNYLKEENGYNYNAKEFISNLRVYCRKNVPFVYHYKEQMSSYTHTAHSVLLNEKSLILPNLPRDRKRKERYNYITNNRFYWFSIWEYI